MTETEKTVEENKPKIAQSVSEILSIVKKRETAHAFGIQIPSLNREIKFCEINTSQQKRLVKSIIDSPIYNTEFINTLHDIIKENCMELDIDVGELTVLDKLIIALKLRIYSIGDIIEVEIDLKNGNKTKVKLDLGRVYELALTNIKIPEKIIVKDDYYVVECFVPTIGNEVKMEKELRNNVTHTEIQDSAELRKIIGDAFVGELVKYVNRISVLNEKGEEILIPWSTYTFKQRIQIVETFKTKLLKEIIEYINGIKQEVDKIELINFEVDGEKYEKRLTIDGSFFMIS